MDRDNIRAKKRIWKYRVWVTFGIVAAILSVSAALWLVTLPKLQLKSGELISGRYHIPAGHYHIGDLIPVELQIRTLAGVRYRQPELAASALGKLELKRDNGTVTVWRRDGRLETLRYLVTAWEVGEYNLPGLTIRYQFGHKSGVSRISPADLKVESVLPAGKNNADLLKLDIKGIKGPLDLPPRYQILYWSLVILALLTLIIILGIWIRNQWRKREKSASIREVDPIGSGEPAHIIALRRLGILETGELILQKAWKGYYSELSDISREYMEKRFHTKALEMTTEEFAAALAASQSVSREHQKILTDVLKTADLVKFAKYFPLEDTAQADLNAVRRLVEETAERPAENPPEATENTPELEVPA